MGEYADSAPAILASIVFAYVLGAIPMAVLVSRQQGVDIFSVGTGLPGASNVMRSVGRVPGAVVLAWDFVKGAAVVLAAWWIGADGNQVLFAVSAVLVGHWFSVFTGFRGGDGLATLGGPIALLFGAAGVITLVVATLVALGGQRMPYSSLLSLVFGYATLVGLNLTQEGDKALTAGIGGLAGLVLARAILGHLKRRQASEWEGLGESDGATDQSG